MVKLKIKAEINKANADKLTKISADIPIGVIVTHYPDLAQVLTEDYGFHCVGCFASTMETLEQGAAVHGMDDGEIEEMVIKLNKLIA